MQETGYLGLARVVWVDRRPIHSPESESPEALGTVVRGGNPPVENSGKTGLDHSAAHRYGKLAFSSSAWYHAKKLNIRD